MKATSALFSATAAFAAVVPTSALQARPPIALAAVQKIGGTLEDGTVWQVQMPAHWNGTLLLDLDGAGFPGRAPAGNIPFIDWLLSQGNAYGGTQREPVGYDFPQAVDHLLDVKRQVASKWHQPTRTISIGGSRGAFVVRKALELHPEAFDGGLLYAGGGAGEIAVLNNKLNTLFVLKTLVDPVSPLRLVNIDLDAETRAQAALLAKATATPQGRARLALAGAVEQFAPWTSRGKPKPARTDYDAQVDQLAENFIFATALPLRAGVEKLVGGNVSWNHGVDYAGLLRNSGRQAMVEALYAKAGLSLADDLATLARAPRIAADPAAIRRAEPLMTYTGKITDPLVDVDNDDPVEPATDKLVYLQTLQRAGTAPMFRLLWVDQPGHMGQSDLDRAVAFRMLMDRIQTGRWDGTSLPELRRMADDIARTSPVPLGGFTFFDPGPLPKPINSWDSSRWGSYSPTLLGQ